MSKSDLIREAREDIDSILRYIATESSKSPTDTPPEDEFDIVEVLDTVFDRLATLARKLSEVN